MNVTDVIPAGMSDLTEVINCDVSHEVHEWKRDRIDQKRLRLTIKKCQKAVPAQLS